LASFEEQSLSQNSSGADEMLGDGAPQYRLILIIVQMTSTNT
jgi:hypothetical protein